MTASHNAFHRDCSPRARPPRERGGYAAFGQRGRALVVAVAIAFLTPASAWAHDATAAGKPVMSELPDGARLIVLTDPSASEIDIDVFFRVGQSDEGRWPGINTLITRSWISATDNRGAALLQGDIARNGGVVGTASGPDWTEIWGGKPDSEAPGCGGRRLRVRQGGADLADESDFGAALRGGRRRGR